MRFHVLSAACMKMTVFCDAGPCSLVDDRSDDKDIEHLKRRPISTRIHGARCQKQAIFKN